ncbi:MAG: hypothetical protein ACXAAM_03775, partial [Candidatus Heimdallarchaeaceae archaeon]
MKWKKVLWYSLTILLLGFLTYYIIFSTIHIITTFSRTDAIWKQVITLICNFLILLAELFSAFYSVFIYYFIGSSSNYKIIKDEKNSFLTQDPLPKVVVAIPLYKEPLAVVSETIKGALQIDYPKDRFEVVVLDDSPPEHSKDIELFCKEKGVGFVQRKSRKGFKAGAI